MLAVPDQRDLATIILGLGCLGFGGYAIVGWSRNGVVVTGAGIEERSFARTRRIGWDVVTGHQIGTGPTVLLSRCPSLTTIDGPIDLESLSYYSFSGVPPARVRRLTAVIDGHLAGRTEPPSPGPDAV
ncbi:MAG TPA: hypothetical protein VM677_33715 [Actinokineospora sp.]|nr:hypothetical protein [Actinokineospora sp.]